MKSLILDFIQKNPTDWEEKLTQLNIEVKKEDSLALFKYKIDADFSNPLVQEARGIILNLKRNCVAAWPFRKFGNYGESYADKIDWSSARVQEKLDGSIMKLYYLYGRWELATNGTIDAMTVSNQQGYNFGEMGYKTLYEQGLDYDKLNKNYTYIFELTSPNNQIVVPYKETTMWHIGTRNNITGKELIVDIGMPKPKEYPLYSLDDCIAFAKTFSASEHEGFVVVDKNWNRVKVKSPDYIAAHHLKNNAILTPRKIIDLILEGEVEEYLNYFPEAQLKFDSYMAAMDQIKVEISAYCDAIAALCLDKKQYAINHNQDEYFSFAINKIYCNREFDFSKKFWYNKLLKKGD